MHLLSFFFSEFIFSGLVQFFPFPNPFLSLFKKKKKEKIYH